MKHIYYDADLQRDILNSGCRHAIIKWLCWNDPNGEYKVEPEIPTEELQAIMRRMID